MFSITSLIFILLISSSIFSGISPFVSVDKGNGLKINSVFAQEDVIDDSGTVGGSEDVIDDSGTVAAVKTLLMIVVRLRQ